MTRPRAVAVVSGGMDSVTLAHLLAETMDLTVVAIHYGQRHSVELRYAREAAERLGARFHLVDLSGLGAHLSGSALTDPHVPVPHGHYADETMKATVVPNRNAILLSVATGIAVAEGAAITATAVHAGDHPIYPDCRPEFLSAFTLMAKWGNEGFLSPNWRVEAPFVAMTKADIVKVGERLGVPWALTWSCYEGAVVHCGECGTCVERREAFALAEVEDPTMYAVPV